MSLRPSAQDQKEQKDKKKQRRKMVRAKKKERTKEAFAALKALKEKCKQKAEVNAVDRPADTIDVNRPNAVAAHAGVKPWGCSPPLLRIELLASKSSSPVKLQREQTARHNIIHQLVVVFYNPIQWVLWFTVP